MGEKAGRTAQFLLPLTPFVFLTEGVDVFAYQQWIHCHDQSVYFLFSFADPLADQLADKFAALYFLHSISPRPLLLLLTGKGHWKIRIKSIEVVNKKVARNYGKKEGGYSKVRAVSSLYIPMRLGHNVALRVREKIEMRGKKLNAEQNTGFAE
ncbi:hypothetical protein POVCU2_0015170 [Plasmodium ovale curtisi]|uniref:Uncharacterized protein n=1 Tax=Plasmodium ovale curtisi TaxID=864141 RepID=A0A1A8VSS8_PLAOA|nr:hypothetical protein POVCU2_0015170 [Plasmodium ovale curtisi]